MNTLRTNQDESSSRSQYLTKRPLIAPISSLASAFEDYLTPFLVIAPPYSIVFVSSSKRQHFFFFAGAIYFYRENNSIWEEQLVGTKISSQIHSVSVGLLTTPYFCIIFCFYYFFLFFLLLLFFIIFLIFLIFLVFIFYFLLTKNKQPSGDP